MSLEGTLFKDQERLLGGIFHPGLLFLDKRRILIYS